MTGIDYAARVTKGAALLDEKRPGWEREIDLTRLDVNDPEHCVTAQTIGEGDYFRGKERLRLSSDESAEHGFVLTDDEYDEAGSEGYAPLTQAWRELISSRQAAVKVDG